MRRLPQGLGVKWDNVTQSNVYTIATAADRLAEYEVDLRGCAWDVVITS